MTGKNHLNICSAKSSDNMLLFCSSQKEKAFITKYQALQAND